MNCVCSPNSIYCDYVEHGRSPSTSSVRWKCGSWCSTATESAWFNAQPHGGTARVGACQVSQQPGTPPYSPNMVQPLHKRVIEVAGLDHVRFADLSHTFTVLSLRSGMSLHALAKILDHDRPYRTKSNCERCIQEHAAKKPVCAACGPADGALKQAAEQLGAMLQF